MNIIKKAYHRNGCSGNGFQVTLFKDKGRKMIAIDFKEEGYIAVFDKDLLDKDNIDGFDNAWRGDVYQKELKTIKGYED